MSWFKREDKSFEDVSWQAERDKLKTLAREQPKLFTEQQRLSFLQQMAAQQNASLPYQPGYWQNAFWGRF